MNDYLKSQKILTYDDVALFAAGNNNEPLVDVRMHDTNIITQYIKFDMLEYTGDVIYIRDTIARKIAKIDRELSKQGFRLKVVYGYRHPEVQSKYFDARRKHLGSQYPELNEIELDRLTHNFVAVPSIAGHPAGAAIDLTVTDVEGNPIDMGTGIADYDNPKMIPTFAKGLTESQYRHRVLLHDAMVAEGFAPFYGEWWHFSYGDREWAAFYNKKALYGPVDFKV